MSSPMWFSTLIRSGSRFSRKPRPRGLELALQSVRRACARRKSPGEHLAHIPPPPAFIQVRPPHLESGPWHSIRPQTPGQQFGPDKTVGRTEPRKLLSFRGFSIKPQKLQRFARTATSPADRSPVIPRPFGMCHSRAPRKGRSHHTGTGRGTQGITHMDQFPPQGLTIHSGFPIVTHDNRRRYLLIQRS